jgi:hypothetical protein
MAAWVILLFFLFDALGGCLRWLFVTARLEWLSYFSVVLGLGCGAYCCLLRPMRKAHLAVGLWLAFQSLVGCIFLQNLSQVAFGLWLLIPVFIGYAFMEDLENLSPWLFRALLVVYLVLVAAVVLNQFIAFPWEGQKYLLGGHEITGSRSWGMFGIKRAAGTQRSSIGAATLILVLCILLCQRAARTSTRALLLAAAGAGIVFTTTKGVALSWILLSLSMALEPVAGFLVARVAVPLAMGLALALPLAGEALVRQLSLHNPVAMMLLFSTEDRILNTWPEAIRLVAGHGSWLWGRGLGGLGTAQVYFEGVAANPGDNLVLYLWGNFGIPGVLLFAWLCCRLVGSLDGLGARSVWAPRMLLCLTAYGITTSCLDNTALGLCAGMLIARAARPTVAP